MTTKGALIAAMAAGLFGASTPLVAAAADSDKVQCQGVNSCKGKSACHGAGQRLRGPELVQGQGLDQTTEKDCKAKGGKIAK